MNQDDILKVLGDKAPEFKIDSIVLEMNHLKQGRLNSVTINNKDILPHNREDGLVISGQLIKYDYTEFKPRGANYDNLIVMCNICEDPWLGLYRAINNKLYLIHKFVGKIFTKLSVLKPLDADGMLFYFYNYHSFGVIDRYGNTHWSAQCDDQPTAFMYQKSDDVLLIHQKRTITHFNLFTGAIIKSVVVNIKHDQTHGYYFDKTIQMFTRCVGDAIMYYDIDMKYIGIERFNPKQVYQCRLGFIIVNEET
jgi:hypothetical protein